MINAGIEAGTAGHCARRARSSPRRVSHITAFSGDEPEHTFGQPCAGPEWPISPRLRMPTIRLLLLITARSAPVQCLSTFSASVTGGPSALACTHRLGASSSSLRQQWMPRVITSRAVAWRASKLSCANPLQTMSWSVTMPTALCCETTPARLGRCAVRAGSRARYLLSAECHLP